jgi:hypothetical protein
VLLDDGSVWQPPKELQQLWTHLRLLMLESIWSVRCGSSGRPYSSTQVVSRFLSVLRQQIQQDWVRTSGDIRIDSGVPLFFFFQGCHCPGCVAAARSCRLGALSARGVLLAGACMFFFFFFFLE